METGDTNYIYRNELNRACFQHNIAYGDFKDLERKTQSDKVLKDKAFKIASNPKYMDIKEDYFQWFISFLTRNQKEMY